MSSPLLERPLAGTVLAMLVFLAALTPPAGAASFPYPTFTAPFQVVESLNGPGYSIEPISVVLGRFDDDSHRDILAVSNLERPYPGYYLGALSRLSGDGRGGFALANRDELDGQIGQLISGDFNGDGITDVILTTYDEIEIGLYDQAGAVHFSTVLEIDDGVLLVARDFNGDGKQDFAAVGRGSSILRVFLGHGDGSFERLPDVAAAKWPNTVIAGDLDGDGDVDLLMSNLLFSPCAYPNGSTCFNDSHGGFTLSALPVAPECVAPRLLADFDGDGKDDLVEALGVRHGNGDGTFGPRLPLTAGVSVAADFDEDGVLDLAAADGSVVRTMRGLGDGTFSAPTTLEAGSYPNALVVGDANEDGHLDLIVQSGSPVCLLYGDGHGHFGGPSGLAAGLGVSAVVARDLDGDGSVDLVAVASQSNAIATLRGHGDGAFDGAVFHGTGLNPTHSIAVDVNGDGRMDVVVSNYSTGTLSIFLGQTGGTLGVRNDVTALPDVESVAAGDVDEDGRLDLVAASSGEFLVLRNTPGGFMPGFRRSIGVLSPIVLADWDSDGHLDLLTSPRGVLSGLGDGSFPSECDYCAPCGDAGDPCYFSAVMGDMNADCVPDMAFGVNWDPFRGGQVYAVSMTSPISYDRLSGVSVHEPGPLAIGDFNGDGRQDLAMIQREGVTSVFFNDGNGQLTNRIDFGTGRDPTSIAAADFNGDGRLDLAVACRGSNAVFVHLNGGSVAPPPAPLEDDLAQGGEASIDLSWKRPTAPVAAYKVYYDLAGHSPLAGTQAREGTSPVIVSATQQAFTLHCLAQQRFGLRVAAVDALGREQPCLPLLEALPAPLGGQIALDPAAGRWLTLSVSLHQGFTPDQVLVPSVRLNGVGPPVKVWTGTRTELKLRFERSAASGAVASGILQLTGRVLGCRDTLDFAIRDTLNARTASNEASSIAEDVPAAFALQPISPNPVSGGCNLGFDLPRATTATLRVFDLSGRQVAEIVNGSMSAGRHQVRWDTARVPGGLYFLRLQAGDFVTSRRFTVR